MTVSLKLDSTLFFPNIAAKTSDEALKYLAKQLELQGYVKTEYAQAILDREKQYPTGLPSAEPAVAIPHADYTLVKETTLAVATLKDPVMFHNMGSVSEEIPIRIIIMMAIGEPHGQIEMLQRIISIVQDDEVRNKMIQTNDPKQLRSIVEPLLID